METQATERRTIANRYVVVERVETHGSSQLFTATHAETGRNVVIREFIPPASRQADALARISQVAAVTSRFLATLVDAAPMGDASIYVVHEQLSGESLAKRLGRKGVFTPAEGAALCARVLKGLDALHRREQVHGGLRPSRVFHQLRQGHGWHVKLLGAGVDSVGREDARRDGSIGRYMPPEWLDGGAWTPRGDVFTAGLVLYECITGRPAFEASTLGMVTPPLEPLAAVAPELVDLLRATLSIVPGERPENAAALLDQLLLIHPEDGPVNRSVTQRSEWTKGKFVGKAAPVGFALPKGQTETRTTIARRKGDVRRARWTGVAITACFAALVVLALFVQSERREKRLVERLATERARMEESQRAEQSAARFRQGNVEAVAVPVVAPVATDAAVAAVSADAGMRVAVATHAGHGGHGATGGSAVAVEEGSDMGVLEVHVATPCALMLDGIPHGESTVMQMLTRDGTHQLTCARARGGSNHLVVHVRVGQRTTVRFNELGQAEVSMEALANPQT